MRQRNAGRRRATGRRRNSRQGSPAKTRSVERFGFLAAAAENKRIPAFQAHHAFALTYEPHQQLVDMFLAVGHAAGSLADRNQGRVPARQRENFPGDQPVVENDVGPLHNLQRAESQHARIARPGADKPCLATDRIVRVVEQRPCKFARNLCVASARFTGDRAVEKFLPESQSRTHIDNPFSDLAPKLSCKLCELAESRGQHAFNVFANATRQYRCAAARRYRHDHRTAIDDGRRDETAVVTVVDGITKDAAAFGGLGDVLLDGWVSGSTDHEPAPVEVGCHEFSGDPTQPGALLEHLIYRGRQIRRDHGHAGAGCEQQASLAARHVATADEQAAPAGQRKECGKMLQKCHQFVWTFTISPYTNRQKDGVFLLLFLCVICSFGAPQNMRINRRASGDLAPF